MGIIDFFTKLASLGNPAIPIIQQQNYWNAASAEENAKKISSTDALQMAADAKADAAVGGHYDLQFPAKSPRRVTSPFSMRTLIIDGKEVTKQHIGADINGARDIFAPEDMIVKKILELDKQYPNRFIKSTRKDGTIAYSDGIAAGKIPEGRAWTPYILAIGVHTKTMYKFKHCLVKGKLKVGQQLDCGDLFAVSGDYGYSQGPHCHHETWLYSAVAKKSKYEGGVTNWPEPMDPILYYRDKGVIS